MILSLLVIFSRHSLRTKVEKIGNFFSNCNPIPSSPSVARDDRKQFQCSNIVFGNKTRPVFWGFH